MIDYRTAAEELNVEAATHGSYVTVVVAVSILTCR